MSKLINSI